MEGLPEGAKPLLELQLSSPIEDATLSEIYDPLNNDPAPEGSVVVFKGVETAVACLSITAMDADIPLGSSATHELAPLCVLDAMDIKDQYVTELPVAIVAEGQPAAAVVAEETTEEKPDQPESEEIQIAEAEVVEEKDDAAKKGEIIQPTCTVTLRVTYKPSPKDQREELYELLNKTSQRKATALENLRKISMTMTRSAGDSAPSDGSTTTVAKPTVKPGFLNKKKKEPTRMQKLYERTLGPNSMLRMGFGLAVVGKNYVIFFGAVGFFHFQGQMLALPPPV